MTTPSDIRWKQRFSNYCRALSQLREFIKQPSLNKLEQQGLIQAFEYTHELAWKTLQDFLKDRGNSDIYGSKDATRAAFAAGLIHDGEVWMDMIKSRNLTSHTYNEEVAQDIVHAIQQHYVAAFEALQQKMQDMPA